MIGINLRRENLALIGYWVSIKGGAVTRNLKFTISADQFREITKQNCYYCGQNPSTIQTGKTHYGEYVYNGIDRIDNNIGYNVCLRKPHGLPWGWIRF